MSISRPVHFAANGIISLFFMAELYSSVCVCVCVCVCSLYVTASSLPIHLSATVNSAAVYTEVHVSFQIMVFSGCMPSSGIAGSYGSSIPSF